MDTLLYIDPLRANGIPAKPATAVGNGMPAPTVPAGPAWEVGTVWRPARSYTDMGKLPMLVIFPAAVANYILPDPFCCGN